MTYDLYLTIRATVVDIDTMTVTYVVRKVCATAYICKVVLTSQIALTPMRVGLCLKPQTLLITVVLTSQIALTPMASGKFESQPTRLSLLMLMLSHTSEG
jgi:hypothetical protein